MADSIKMTKRQLKTAQPSTGLHTTALMTGAGLDAGAFSGKLLTWYDENARDLPWRAKPGERADAYGVWLSEIMLQQTTVKAVIPYFTKFLERWPRVQDLAAAPRDEILAAWAGLGYYSRARNLHLCAKVLADEGFPATAAALQKLPGVGPYTAAAIAAIAFGEPAAVVDGNVERVLARVAALETPLPAAKPALRRLAQSLTPELRAGDYAQAMMDLGATVCTPRRPTCLLCPVQKFCAAYAIGTPEIFPRKQAKAAKPTRSCTAYVIIGVSDDGPHVLLRTRPDKGLLGGMLEVPSTPWDTKTKSSAPQPLPADALSKLSWQEAGAVGHTFTHFHLEVKVLAAQTRLSQALAQRFQGEWVAVPALQEAALPSLMQKIVKTGLAVCT